MLSEADRDAAHRFLSKLSSDSTRDCSRLAPIHFAFADRFFPGTSVQRTASLRLLRRLDLPGAAGGNRRSAVR
jgi:hypothetical protein